MVGSLFSGIGGLDLALEHRGHTVAWQVENDLACAAVLARHWPGVPNLGDVTAIDWDEVPRVDIICGGFPCQDLSYAGRGAGITPDTRSGLWFRMWDAVRHLRPRYVVVENVRALLVRGARVTSDLAALGYVGRWGVVRASDAGAPHQRARVFIVAHAEDERHERAGEAWRRWAGPADGRPPANAHGCEGLPTINSGNRTASGRLHAGHADRRRDDPRWGAYAPAIARWEAIFGEPAPDPLDGGGRLNPDLSRWMMGLPAGWLDGMTRTQALRAAGNAVCPQQAMLALDLLEMPCAYSATGSGSRHNQPEEAT